MQKRHLAVILTAIIGISVGMSGIGQAATISDGVLAMLHQRISQHQKEFFLYRDADSAFNHGFPSGFFGKVSAISLQDACIDDPGTDFTSLGCTEDWARIDRVLGNVLQVSFAPLASGQFAGLNIEEPRNWGVIRTGKGYDLRGTERLVFEARSPSRDGVWVQFGVGGRTSAYQYFSHSQTYQTISISLSSLGLTESALADIHILFSVAANSSYTANGGTLLLDNIRFEPAPSRQQSALGLPLSTETFGIRPVDFAKPGRVPIPVDQINRNYAAIYEAAIALIALVNRGTKDDLEDARLIANAFDHALHHYNQGDPLPLAPDGSKGLHNAYMGGDIALYNAQNSGAGQEGQVRLPGFSASECAPLNFCLVLDGATGGNNAFAILSLVSAYQALADEKYLQDARIIGNWIIANLLDASRTGYGGYFLGYPDEGIIPKTLIKAKSIENNGDIFAALAALGAVEEQLGNIAAAKRWAEYANLAGDFVLKMFDPASGCFLAGTVPIGTPAGPGTDPSGTQRGDDVINTFKFLDANSFTILALAASPRYRDRIDWRKPARCMLDRFPQTISAEGVTYQGFNLVETPIAGPNGIAWEFTGQVVATLRFLNHIFGSSSFQTELDLYLNELKKAQTRAPMGDGLGLVASTLQRSGQDIPPSDQCLSTPFQCIPQRVGLASSLWGLYGEQGLNPFLKPFPDTDRDMIPDIWDNCMETPNPAQREGDGDGAGNLCDADLNNEMNKQRCL